MFCFSQALAGPVFAAEPYTDGVEREFVEGLALSLHFKVRFRARARGFRTAAMGSETAGQPGAYASQCHARDAGPLLSNSNYLWTSPGNHALLLCKTSKPGSHSGLASVQGIPMVGALLEGISCSLLLLIPTA